MQTIPVVAAAAAAKKAPTNPAQKKQKTGPVTAVPTKSEQAAVARPIPTTKAKAPASSPKPAAAVKDAKKKDKAKDEKEKKEENIHWPARRPALAPKVPYLKAQLKARGLSTKGRKHELMKRLQEADPHIDNPSMLHDPDLMQLHFMAQSMAAMPLPFSMLMPIQGTVPMGFPLPFSAGKDKKGAAAPKKGANATAAPAATPASKPGAPNPPANGAAPTLKPIPADGKSASGDTISAEEKQKLATQYFRAAYIAAIQAQGLSTAGTTLPYPLPLDPNTPILKSGQTRVDAPKGAAKAKPKAGKAAAGKKKAATTKKKAEK